MACERYRETLADVAAGGPAPAAVETHLASCAGCRGALAALRQALALADAEIGGMLSAAPSPELTARIRQAVADLEPSPEWRLGWLWPATAAVATLLVALAVWEARGPSASPRAAVAPGPSQPASGPRPTEPAPVIPSDSVSPRPEASAWVAGPSPQGRTARVPVLVRVSPEPEVLVPPGEGEALLRLVALVHRERLSPVGLAAAGQPSADLPGPVPLEINPIEIVPLDPAETTGT